MSVVYFLLMVGVLVSVHELGHFVAAKALGVRVLRFSLGFGPAIARIRGRETEYQIGVVPLGGYVRMLGEDPADPIAEEDLDRSFSHKPLWKRLVVVFAGPAANLLCPVLIYFAFYAGHTELPAAVLGDVFPAGPAANAGLKPGDRVLEVNGELVLFWEDLEQTVDGSAGKTLRFKVRRGDTEFYSYVTPRRYMVRSRNGEQTEQGLIGVTQAPFEPRIGVLDAASPAARAGLKTGDRVISVAGRPVGSYAELEQALRGAGRRLQVAYVRAEPARMGFAEVRLHRAAIADLVTDSKGSGIASAEFFVAAIEPGSPADRAGLRVGDLVTKLDGAPVTHWLLFEQTLMASPRRAFEVTWQRTAVAGGVAEISASITQEDVRVVDEYGQAYGQLMFGASNDFKLGHGEMVPIGGRFAYAATHAALRTGETISVMARGLLSLLGGQIPHDTVGGPIMMFRMASVSGAKGWDAFLMMLALISINLGLINLLPIPILDGGHVVMFAVEGIRRRRLPVRVREVAQLSGLVVIVGLTVLALRNDIVRYLLP